MKEISQPTSSGQPAVGGISKKNRRWFVIVTILGGLFLGLVVVEIALRIVGYSSPDFYAPDEILGYALIPNMSGVYRKEGKSYVQINSAGFRDVEHTVIKPPGVFRIAVIGDSYVEAMQVEQQERFTNYVRDEIRDCGVMGDRQVEILSFGVSGYGTAQELLLTEKVFEYSPDLVMLVMTTNNDITDNSRVLKRTPIPYFTVRGGELVQDNGFRQERSFVVRNSGLSRLGIQLKNSLRFVQAIGAIQVGLKYKYREWKDKPAVSAPSPNAAPSDAAPAAEIGIDNQVYIPPGTADWEDAWSVTEALIGAMKEKTESHGAKFAVVTASNGVQVLPNVSERTAFAGLLGVEDLYYPDRRIADFCRARSVPVITLAPVLADHAARDGIYLHGFPGNIGYGHWNQAGHRIAGKQIGGRLCEEVLP